MKCPLHGKHCFPTASEAHQAAANMDRKHKGKPSVYQCNVCNHWHITHYTYSESRRFRQYLSSRPKKKKQNKDMQIFIDTASKGKLCLDIIKGDDGIRRLRVTLLGEDQLGRDLRASQLIDHNEALELDEALKMMVSKM